MTVDAVGGVWRYAMDLAGGLRSEGFETVFAGFGPRPSPDQAKEADELGKLFWHDAPLDWMTEDEGELQRVPELIRDLALRERVNLLHLNLPSQATGLVVDVPVVVVAHSCVATWFRAVRGHAVPEQWQWQTALNAKAFSRAHAVISPSHSHAALLRVVYGPIERLEMVYNSSRAPGSFAPKQNFAFAAGRWWDEGKNGTVLDAAAAATDWPVIAVGANHGPNGQYLPLRHVVHRGELGHAETVALMAQAAVVVSPSLYEPFGLAALEAARGKSALVLADIPTYRELWDEVALFADPHDPQAFADAIDLLSRDDVLRSELAEGAFVRAQEFSIEAQARSVRRVYERLLSSTYNLTAAE
jgi:glycosyltransferase involved in cell wall biosynthesis